MATVACSAIVMMTACTATPSVPSPSPSAPTAAAVVVPSGIPNDPALRADASMSTCAAAGNGWKAAGLVNNSSSHRRDYHLTVLFTTTEATAIGVGTTIVHVAAGAKTSWTVMSAAPVPPPALCVLSGVG